MTKISCVQCKHHWFSKLGRSHICMHPDAQTYDRVQGYSYATVGPWDQTPQAVVDCDREGRFEPYRPWWQFWRTA